MYQLCKGIEYCHGHGVLHRDLKPHNLLLDKEKGILKIADLGLGRAYIVPMKHYNMRFLHFGIELQRYCWGRSITRVLSICGL